MLRRPINELVDAEARSLHLAAAALWDRAHRLSKPPTRATAIVSGDDWTRVDRYSDILGKCGFQALVREILVGGHEIRLFSIKCAQLIPKTLRMPHTRHRLDGLSPPSSSAMKRIASSC